ncbi:DUF421 domain-containing protein [Paraliobacillus sp. X-1268]|uniref:DUF421 domain-containing protein n=1 Tax=Paraliobacillus sp. X-1268 TaxID=2213193 RepID=UPI000E3C1BDE|nr:DUF421 domain-containing protein [Paraliobacillus sp. X-1268]
MDFELGTLIFRTFFIYIIVVIIFRLMGKREIGELSILDIVVFIMVAEMAVFTVEDTDRMLIEALIPMGLLLFIQRTVAWLSLKNKHFRDWFEGKASVIISRGKVDEYEMKKNRYTFDDLLQQLRENGTKSIQDVAFAILEPSGKLSIFENANQEEESAKNGFVVPLIIDGVIQLEGLEKIDQNESWLIANLKQKGYADIKQISFCSLDQSKNWFVDIKNEYT